MILETQLRDFQSKKLQMNLKVPGANFTRHSARLRKPISLRAPVNLGLKVGYMHRLTLGH